jgi:hypothetical protein
MFEREQMYPSATGELAEQRKRLAPGPAEAFAAFSVSDPRASVLDLELTKVIDGNLVKVMSWYDKEWSYANQKVREAVSVRGARRTPAVNGAKAAGSSILNAGDSSCR